MVHLKDLIAFDKKNIRVHISIQLQVTITQAMQHVIMQHHKQNVRLEDFYDVIYILNIII